MATSEGSNCNNCHSRHLSTPAVTWCPDCQEAFCQICQEYHDALKIAKYHKTIPIDDLVKLPSFVADAKSYCEIHDDRYEFYCSVHQQCCCLDCVKESHRQCCEIDTLRNVVKNVKSSPALEDIEASLRDISEYIKNITENRKENSNRIAEQKEICQTELRKFRSLVNEHLDKFEEKLMNDVTSKVEEFLVRNNNIMTDLEEHKRQIAQLHKEVLLAKAIATEMQVFLGLKTLEERLKEETLYLETLRKGQELDDVNIQLDLSDKVQELYSSIDSIATVTATKTPCTVNANYMKKEQAQNMLSVENSLVNIQIFEKKCFFVMPPCDSTLDVTVTGCTILPTGQIVIADSSNKRLVVYSKCTKFKREITTSSYPRDVTYVCNSTIAITYPDKESVGLLDLINGNELSSFKTHSKCYGIECVRDKLYVKATGFVLITTFHGDLISKLKVSGQTHVCLSGDNIVTQKYTDGKVFCYGANGDLLWTFSDDMMKQSGGITTDQHGFVYVTGEISKNLVVITPDGKQRKEIVVKFGCPCSLYYEKSSDTMLVCKKNGLCDIYDVKR